MQYKRTKEFLHRESYVSVKRAIWIVPLDVHIEVVKEVISYFCDSKEPSATAFDFINTSYCKEVALKSQYSEKDCRLVWYSNSYRTYYDSYNMSIRLSKCASVEFANSLGKDTKLGKILQEVYLAYPDKFKDEMFGAKYTRKQENAGALIRRILTTPFVLVGGNLELFDPKKTGCTKILIQRLKYYAKDNHYAIELCNELGKPVKIFTNNTSESRSKSVAGETIQMTAFMTTNDLTKKQHQLNVSPEWEGKFLPTGMLTANKFHGKLIIVLLG